MALNSSSPPATASIAPPLRFRPASPPSSSKTTPTPTSATASTSITASNPTRRATADITPLRLKTAASPTAPQPRQWPHPPPMDAFRALQYRTPAPSNYNSDPPNIRRMAVWDPWVYDSGWYWQLYNTKARPDANLFGIFAGRA